MRSLLLTLNLSYLCLHCGSSPPKQEMDLTPVKPSEKIALKPVASKGRESVFSTEISLAKRQALELDIAKIPSFDASLNPTHDENLKRILGVDSLSGGTLDNWFRDRIQYFIDTKISRYSFARVYPDAREFGYFQVQDDDPEKITGIGATNISGKYYDFALQLRESEKRDQYIRIQINGKWVDISSARVGIMQIGPALFGFQVNSANDQAYSNSAFRYHILFHEARHSDGNTAKGSLAFSHVICPELASVPPELVGRAACDSSSNGSYTVGALIMRSYMDHCGDQCSEREKAQLSIYYTSSLSRIIRKNEQSPGYLDPTPEPERSTKDISEFTRIKLP